MKKRLYILFCFFLTVTQSEHLHASNTPTQTTHKTYLLKGLEFLTYSVSMDGSVVAGIQKRHDALVPIIYFCDHTGLKSPKRLQLPRAHKLAQDKGIICLEVSPNGENIATITKFKTSYHLICWNRDRIQSGNYLPHSILEIDLSQLDANSKTPGNIREVERLSLSHSGKQAILYYYDGEHRNTIIFQDNKLIPLNLQPGEKLVDADFLDNETQIYGTVMHKGRFDYRIWNHEGKPIQFIVPQELKHHRDDSLELFHASLDANHGCATFCNTRGQHQSCLWSKKGDNYEFKALPFPNSTPSFYKITNSFVTNINGSPLLACVYKDPRSEFSKIFCWCSEKWCPVELPKSTDTSEKILKDVGFMPVGKNQTLLMVFALIQVTATQKPTTQQLEIYFLDLKKPELKLENFKEWLVSRKFIKPNASIQKMTYSGLGNDPEDGTYIISVNEAGETKTYLVKPKTFSK